MGVQRLAAAEGEPEIGDSLQGELGDEALERGERHGSVSAAGEGWILGFSELTDCTGQGQRAPKPAQQVRVQVGLDLVLGVRFPEYDLV